MFASLDYYWLNIIIVLDKKSYLFEAWKATEIGTAVLIELCRAGPELLKFCFAMPLTP
jgi:hypothetical protein